MQLWGRIMTHYLRMISGKQRGWTAHRRQILQWRHNCTQFVKPCQSLLSKLLMWHPLRRPVVSHTACSHLHTWFNFERSTPLPVLGGSYQPSQSWAPQWLLPHSHLHPAPSLSSVLRPRPWGMLLFLSPLTLCTEGLISRDNVIHFFTKNKKNLLIFTDYKIKFKSSAIHPSPK